MARLISIIRPVVLEALGNIMVATVAVGRFIKRLRSWVNAVRADVRVLAALRISVRYHVSECRHNFVVSLHRDQ